MTTIDRNHQLGLIRDYEDYLAAKQDIENLRGRGADLDAEEFKYISETRKHLKLFEGYLSLALTKPQARDLLAYLLDQVKKVSLTVLAGDTGIVDVSAILSGHRQPSQAEAKRLSDYFGVAADAFL